MKRTIASLLLPALALGSFLLCCPAQEAAAGVDVGVSINLGPPPIVGLSSTRYTRNPPADRSRAAWIPATPPPITIARLVSGSLLV